MLGHWAVHYLPPCGGRYAGQLWVTNWRVLFVGRVDASLLGRYIVGPLDSLAVACAFDLDDDQVTYEAGWVRIEIRKAQIERAAPVHLLLDHGLSLTLKNNGSVHWFDQGLLPATALMRALNAPTIG